MVSTNGAAFSAVSGIPLGSVIASDKLNDTVFYAASGSSLYVSTNSGKSFTETNVLGNAQSSVQIAASPFTAGEFYVSTSSGIFHSTNYGKTITGLNGVTEGWSIAVGAPSTKGGTPSLFAAASIGGINALYRTDNVGSSWSKLTNAQYGLSSASDMVLAADPNTYSQVYVGTNGRGIFYGHA